METVGTKIDRSIFGVENERSLALSKIEISAEELSFCRRLLACKVSPNRINISMNNRLVAAFNKQYKLLINFRGRTNEINGIIFETIRYLLKHSETIKERVVSRTCSLFNLQVA